VRGFEVRGEVGGVAVTVDVRELVILVLAHDRSP
jgi:hypothetical protein